MDATKKIGVIDLEFNFELSFKYRFEPPQVFTKEIGNFLQYIGAYQENLTNDATPNEASCTDKDIFLFLKSRIIYIWKII